MNYSEKFDDKAIVYSKYRPKYSNQFIAYLYNCVGFCKNSCIADIGSGTGILTKALLDKESYVYGIEPNNDMRKKAEKDLNIYSNFKSINSTAEDTSLPDKCVNFITVGQAFHWFDTVLFKVECNRILKQNGKVVLAWNRREDEQDIIIEHEEINRRFCPEFKGFSGGLDLMLDKIESFFNGEYHKKSFRNDFQINLDSFIGGSLSASYSLNKNDHNFDDYISELSKLFLNHAKKETLILKNKTIAYIGELTN